MSFDGAEFCSVAATPFPTVSQFVEPWGNVQCKSLSKDPCECPEKFPRKIQA
jgi:hypothetical protein